MSGKGTAVSLKVRVLLALGCAVAAVVFMALFASGVRGEAEEQRRDALERYGGETALVCVASRDIARGETFSDRNVETVEWLVDLLPEGALVDPGSVVGKTAASAVAQNTPLAAVDVDDQGEPVDVPAGAVAVSVPCSSSSAVGGALTVGATVDVYVVASEGARLLCQGVQVLGTNAEGTSAKLSWATLAIDPSQVEAVIAAASMQSLYFALPSDEALAQRALALQGTVDPLPGGGEDASPGQEGDPTAEGASEQEDAPTQEGEDAPAPEEDAWSEEEPTA